MAATFEMDVNVKSPADAYWNTIKNMIFLYPELFPEVYENIEILEGDGISAGSVRLANCVVGCPLGQSYKSKILSLDEENKTVSYSIFDVVPLGMYKFLNDKITVRETGNGTVACWSCTYEKAMKEAPDGELMSDSVVKMLKKFDDYTLANMNKN